jgi:hypothetical protein
MERHRGPLSCGTRREIGAPHRAITAMLFRNPLLTLLVVFAALPARAEAQNSLRPGGSLQASGDFVPAVLRTRPRCPQREFPSLKGGMSESRLCSDPYVSLPSEKVGLELERVDPVKKQEPRRKLRRRTRLAPLPSLRATIPTPRRRRTGSSAKAHRKTRRPQVAKATFALLSLREAKESTMFSPQGAWTFVLQVGSRATVVPIEHWRQSHHFKPVARRKKTRARPRYRRGKQPRHRRKAPPVRARAKRH